MEDETEMLLRHQFELKNLRMKSEAMIQKAPKKDKAKRKKVVDETKNMEAELLKNHRRELNILRGLPEDAGEETSGEAGVSEVAKKIDDMKTTEDEDLSDRPNPNGEGGFYKQQEMSKAQKKKQAKRRAEAEKEKQMLEEKRAASLTAPRTLEMNALNKALGLMGMRVKDIEPDGNCMFRSVADQLAIVGVGGGDDHEAVRRKAVSYIRSHSDNFVPFLEESLDEYCEKLSTPSKWGGEPELMALAGCYGLVIVVHSANAPPMKWGDESAAKGTINLSYHKHMYGLGEHYNSVVKV